MKTFPPNKQRTPNSFAIGLPKAATPQFFAIRFQKHRGNACRLNQRGVALVDERPATKGYDSPCFARHLT